MEMLISFALGLALQNTQVWSANMEPQKQVRDTLAQFHEAASQADGAKYFSLFTPDGVFIGTDATERWTLEQFETYAEPHFKKGKGWTYVQKTVNVDINSAGDTAWFDEILESKSYGICRGTGVLKKMGNAWKVAQYHLTIPVPNDLADSVVKQIRALVGVKN